MLSKKCYCRGASQELLQTHYILMFLIRFSRHHHHLHPLHLLPSLPTHALNTHKSPTSLHHAIFPSHFPPLDQFLLSGFRLAATGSLHTFSAHNALCCFASRLFAFLQPVTAPSLPCCVSSHAPYHCFSKITFGCYSRSILSVVLLLVRLCSPTLLVTSLSLRVSAAAMPRFVMTLLSI